MKIYLDYAATTPVDERVADKMWRYLKLDGVFGNSASTHAFGLPAKQAVEIARAQVAEAVNAEVDEIIWTSGATEAINLALKGAARLYQRKGKHIVTLKTEHSAVLDSCQALEKEGFAVTYLSPDANGVLSLDALKNALRDDTILVSLSHVNNEIGVIHDLQAIAELTASKDILLHVDAAQTIGKVKLDLAKTPVDLVSFCAHKSYGPKGIGALFVRRKPRIKVAAQIHGGGQEQGMRSGTLPVHQIVGMGEAFAIALREFDQHYQTVTTCREHFWKALSVLEDAMINGDAKHGVPHILNIHFPDVLAADLMKALPDLAVSTGSACHARGAEPSHVLRALGLSLHASRCSLRFSFGRFTTLAEIDAALAMLIPAVKTLRAR